MEDNKILKLTYTFFLGILIATFIGVGINTFYEAPKYPETPSILKNSYDKEPTSEQLDAQIKFEMQQFEMQQEEYAEIIKPYNRNVSIITLIFAVLLLILSIIFEKKMKFISDGIMLGSLFTLIYGIGRGFASEDSKFIFIAVSIGLLAVLYVGYHRFVKLNINKKVSLENKN
ncbi:MAG TPA: hypothetical protein PLO25_01780 [Candidatus Saccharibacteria bacterium]|nr:hypothetical protein [Candidatus Saccharibacteria bacterium]